MYLSPEQIRAAYAENGENQRATARALGIARTTLQDHLRRMDATPISTSITPEMVLKDRVQRLEAELKQFQRNTLDEHYVRTQILNIKQAVDGMAPPRWLSVPEVRPKRSQSVPTLFLSDLHWGEVVDKQQVGGVNEYNIQIANRRLDTVVSKSISLLRGSITGEDYPGIILPLGGDMLAGDIHEELRESNDGSTLAALLDLLRSLISQITLLAKEFGKVYVPCVVGNHGRTTHKPRAKGRNETNLDWLLYQFLALHFQGDECVVIDSPVTPELTFKVYNHTYHLCHGDQLGKGGDGIIGSFGPIIRGDQKRRSLQAQLNRPYDTLLHGHYHTYAATRKFISNGCFPAGSPVTMVDGSIKPIDDVSIGDVVLTRQGNGMPVVDTYSRSNADALVVLRCGTRHSEIRLTGNHKVWAVKGGTVGHWVTQNGEMVKTPNLPEAGWIEAKYLSSGDYVEMPTLRGDLDIPEMTPEFCRLLGFYLAEGSASGPNGRLHHIDFSLHRDEEDYADFIYTECQAAFGKARHYLPKGDLRKNSRSVVVDSTDAAHYMVALAGKGSKNKALREDLLLLPAYKQKEILLGWLLGDGHTAKCGRYRRGTKVSGTTISRKLIEQMRLIALRCGYFASIGALAPGVGGRRKNTSYTLAFTGDTARTLAKDLGEYVPAEHDLLREKPNDFKAIRIGDVFFARLTDVWIEESDQPVFNLVVAEDHTYVINSVGVANSLPGYDEYAMACGFGYDIPQQAFWLTHQEHGITFSMPVHAERPVKPEAREWLSFEKAICQA